MNVATIALSGASMMMWIWLNIKHKPSTLILCRVDFIEKIVKNTRQSLVL